MTDFQEQRINMVESQVRTADAHAAAMALVRTAPPKPSMRSPAASPIQRIERRNCGAEAAIAIGSRSESRRMATAAATQVMFVDVDKSDWLTGDKIPPAAPGG